MKLAVKLYKDIPIEQNLDSIPLTWVAQIIELERINIDGKIEIIEFPKESGWVSMTTEELELYKKEHQEEYNN